jgi:tRNA threonylcarbamoyladenosine biosynthesis protein TsaB
VRLRKKVELPEEEQFKHSNLELASSLVKSNHDFKTLMRAFFGQLEGISVVLILALDCGVSAGSVALLTGSQTIAEQTLDSKKRSAVTLAPAIAAVMSQAGKEMADVRLVATTVGPGSFTGLRIGITMAKVLAYALKCDLVGINTLDVLATQVFEAGLVGKSGIVHAVLDAQRKELFAGRYQAEMGRLDKEDSILSVDTWLSSLQAGDVVTGSGLARYKDKLPEGVTMAPENLHYPSAVTVGRLALREHAAGRRDKLWTFSPLYLRPSYADEKKPAPSSSVPTSP